MKTLIINDRPLVAGNPAAVERARVRILRKTKPVNPSVALTEGMIFKLEEKA